ncbi:MAG: TIGR01459 family HAD-type hydrolase [Sphingomicrobium sp.]
MIDLDALDARYRLILCDIWGVVHDGVTLYPGAAERLVQWRGQGRAVVLITNAPRTAEAVEQQLQRIGLPRDAWDGIATSGEAGIAALSALGQPVGFLGTDQDREILESRAIVIADGAFTDLACTGLDQQRPDPNDYAEQLAAWAGADVLLHCLNPDRMVIRGGIPEACAGALADLYEGLGGRVAWYGKPHPAIYDHALRLAGSPPPTEVLAIGDSLRTDVLGAARMGFDCLFVAGGIHAGEPFPSDFGRDNGLDGWQPVAIVDSLR